jgi:hypothetical protein
MFRAFFEKIKFFLAVGKSNNNLKRLDLTDENLASEISEAEGLNIPAIRNLKSNYDYRTQGLTSQLDFLTRKNKIKCLTLGM